MGPHQHHRIKQSPATLGKFWFRSWFEDELHTSFPSLILIHHPLYVCITLLPLPLMWDLSATYPPVCHVCSIHSISAHQGP